MKNLDEYRRNFIVTFEPDKSRFKVTFNLYGFVRTKYVTLHDQSNFWYACQRVILRTSERPLVSARRLHHGLDERSAYNALVNFILS